MRGGQRIISLLVVGTILLASAACGGRKVATSAGDEAMVTPVAVALVEEAPAAEEAPAEAEPTPEPIAALPPEEAPPEPEVADEPEVPAAEPEVAEVAEPAPALAEPEVAEAPSTPTEETASAPSEITQPLETSPEPAPPPTMMTEAVEPPEAPAPEEVSEAEPASPPIAEEEPTPASPVVAEEVAEPVAAVPEVAELSLADIYFDFDRFALRPEAKQVLETNAEMLKSRNGWRLLIEGHCDERGTAEYNLVLGERRAQSVLSYLVDLGVPADRLQITSYGKERPFCTDHSDDCWQKNRRAHFVLKP